MKNKYIFFIKLKRLKLLTSIVLIFFVATIAKSQHCEFDNVSIIIVKIHSQYDSKNIPNLRITMLDSNNNSFIYSNDTVIFYQNPNKSTFECMEKDYYYYHQIYKDHYCNFPFAKDNYIFVCSNHFPLNDYKLKIEDIDGQKNSGEFETAIIQIFDIDKHKLCRSYFKGEYQEIKPKNYGRVYNPIEIILHKKQ